MSRLVRPLLLASAAVGVFGPARVSEACWASRVFTRNYCDPCVTCPTVTTCPTTSCNTTNVERCYYEPKTVYETRSLMQPQVSYVRRSYYDPATCCNRSYLEPVTQYVERCYQVPVTTWVKRCSTEPVTTCTTTYAPAVGASYFVPPGRVASYWSPDGYYYYPVYTTITPTSCPVPSSNGATDRSSGYGPPADSKKSGESTTEPPKAPDPIPMPEKKEGAKSTSSQRTNPAIPRGTVQQGRPVVLVPGSVTTSGWRPSRSPR